MGYRPGTWAKASTVVGGLGYFANIWWAAHDGADTAVAAFVHVILVFVLVVLPLIVGSVIFQWARRSQRAGDWAFAVCMIAQGVFLAVAPALG